MNKTEFDFEGKKYTVRLPNSKERSEGERIYNRVFAAALADGCFIEARIMKVAKEHGVWSEEKDAEVAALRKELEDGQTKLDEGGIELAEAKEIALAMRKSRNQLLIYNLMLEELKSQSVNRKADNARTEYFVSRCLLDEKGRQVFRDLDDFYMNQNGDLAQLGTYNFSRVWYNYNADSWNFPEDDFLKEFGLDEPAPEKKERKPFLQDGKPIEPKKEPDGNTAA